MVQGHFSFPPSFPLSLNSFPPHTLVCLLFCQNPSALSHQNSSSLLFIINTCQPPFLFECSLQPPKLSTISTCRPPFLSNSVTQLQVHAQSSLQVCALSSGHEPTAETQNLLTFFSSCWTVLLFCFGIFLKHRSFPCSGLHLNNI